VKKESDTALTFVWGHSSQKYTKCENVKNVQNRRQC